MRAPTSPIEPGVGTARDGSALLSCPDAMDTEEVKAPVGIPFDGTDTLEASPAGTLVGSDDNALALDTPARADVKAGTIELAPWMLEAAMADESA